MPMNKKNPERKTYFILRSTDYKPDGLIQLGQLIEDPHTPYRRIAPPIRPLPADAVHVSLKNDWSLDKSKGAAGELGVFAQFLAVITAEASAHASNEFTQSWSAAQLETAFLELGSDKESDYVTSSVQKAAVQKRLTREGFFKKMVLSKKVLYMVTGVKIARRPGQVSSGATKTTGGAVKLGADPGTGGVVTTGVQGGLDRSSSFVESSTPDDDFVFAYRLRKVHVNFSSNTSLLGNDVSGAELHGHGAGGGGSDTSSDEESDEEVPEEVVVDVDEIDKVLVEKEDFGDSLPARDEKNDGLDEFDSGECLVIVA
ncbi:hypothetical protein CH063_06407 [Colletotrichum higginsianum]|uniref:Uncharacterized protein n=2 Tax=Colletotrichum higginsianum TaxID=80884 RepID=H1V2F3_COLHI|nr:hypothetical protein CH63R_01595 [Colletotrichum higginsianum IMI 349063]OBR16415.1 hypothetical protein CH63R_01595 [Colletotrichum higginsianum IMI 349063]TID04585.1 hypothetical protein CH35J_001894 [Colletotrichum higginsianum]CCF34405.1 hypothetical protein CH063_06407 [Colletotrichum higginsianum]